MKLISVCLLFLTAFSTYAVALEDPIAEWFGGYSYSRINPDFLAEGANSHGFHVDVVLNTRLLGFVTDLSKQYGVSAGTQLSTTTLLFGSRFARRVKNITWFVQFTVRVLLNQRGRRLLWSRDRAVRFEFRICAVRHRDRREAEREDRFQNNPVRSDLQ